MSSDTTFTVPKDRQSVTVRLLHGEALEGTIFLAYTSADLTLLQKVLAFLEDASSFFPLRLNESGATEFINKKNVGVVEIAYAATEEKDSLSLSLMYQVDVAAIFSGENSISGSLLAEVPLEKARLSDCLNLPNNFLIIKTNGNICYVNKSALQKVVYAGKT